MNCGQLTTSCRVRMKQYFKATINGHRCLFDFPLTSQVPNCLPRLWRVPVYLLPGHELKAAYWMGARPSRFRRTPATLPRRFDWKLLRMVYYAPVYRLLLTILFLNFRPTMAGVALARQVSVGSTEKALGLFNSEDGRGIRDIIIADRYAWLNVFDINGNRPYRQKKGRWLVIWKQL